MQKILVTGGAGFLGSNLVNSLLMDDYEVVVFDNGFRVGFDNLDSLAKNLSLIKGNIMNYDDWKLLPKDIDFAFHLAAINGTRFFYEIPEEVIEVNVQGIFNFMKWLSNSNAKQFFFASSSEIYGFPKIFPTPETEPMVIPSPKNPRYSYSSSKILGEIISINHGKKYGFDYTIGRFHNIYGPQMGFEHVIPEFIRKCVKNEEFIVQGDGEESRSFCYISDAIDALRIITQKNEGKNEIFNIGNDKETQIKDLIQSLENIHGKKILPIFQNFEQSGTKRRQPDISKIRKLGYEPKISLVDGLKKTYDWYRNYYLSN